jgi:hypothetical protein
MLASSLAHSRTVSGVYSVDVDCFFFFFFHPSLRSSVALSRIVDVCFHTRDRNNANINGGWPWPTHRRIMFFHSHFHGCKNPPSTKRAVSLSRERIYSSVGV